MPSQRSAAARQPVNLSLDPAVVRRAHNFTPNLSATVERLLAEFADREDARRRAEAARAGRVLAGLNRLRAKHGSLADDFSPF
jgi:antitoxin CcdA